MPDEEPPEGVVWDAALDALRERRDIHPDDDVFDGLDPKHVRTVLHDMTERGWLARNETRGVFQRTGKLRFEPLPHEVSDHARDRAEHAGELREKGAFRRAAGWYTTAASCYRASRPPSIGGDGWYAARYLYRACICRRLAGDEERARRRADEGKHLATDVLADAGERFAPDGPSEEWLGSWCEAIGDFQVCVGADPTEAYGDARSHYERSEYPETGYLDYGEAANAELIGLFNELCRAVDLDVTPWNTAHRETLTPLTEWLDYKWQHLPRLVDALLGRGEWP